MVSNWDIPSVSQYKIKQENSDFFGNTIASAYQRKL